MKGLGSLSAKMGPSSESFKIEHLLRPPTVVQGLVFAQVHVERLAGTYRIRTVSSLYRLRITYVTVGFVITILYQYM